MKKYKLIKEYPYSPEVGIIVEQTNENKMRYKYNDFDISLTIIEHYPEFWQEVKEPLFVTDDGVEIFDEDLFYIPRIISDYIIESHHADCTKTYTKNLLKFKTKEASEQWIKENKPRFSEKQVLDAIEKVKEYNSIYAQNTTLGYCPIIKLKKELGL